MTIPFIEDNDQTRARREHLEALRALVGNVYPNRFIRSRITGGEDTISAIVNDKRISALVPESADADPEAIARANAELNKLSVAVSGRLATPPRLMGKAAFVHLSDGDSRLQIYVRKADVIGVRNDADPGTVDGWELFKLLDHGDFIGVQGFLFVTKTGELSVHVRALRFLAKALVPMPDKMHGISDPEIRRRQRYVDLIAGSLKVERDEGELSTREVFERRSKLIHEMRRYLDGHGYIEVETPMLTPKATGAAARPFRTHHNALDIDLYARIAPELYLKRLLVGGFERVYELNRNFRNEGIDGTHNPEFTMLEFYCAYMDVNGMMDFCEGMIRDTVEKAARASRLNYAGEKIDFARPFERLTMKQAIARYWPEEWADLDGKFFEVGWLDDPRRVAFLSAFVAGMESHSWAEAMGDGEAHPSPHQAKEQVLRRLREAPPAAEDNDATQVDVTLATRIAGIFEAVAEKKLVQPTFIHDLPKPISPLSKASPADPSIAERFELFISAMECANGFSELNDPVEQMERFLEQVRQRERGDEEAMVLDEDYIRALSYGMPPAAGIGIGIDRLAMIITGRRSIRDVILFPHHRP